jgi:inhibitor of cysteine peptidase
LSTETLKKAHDQRFDYNIPKMFHRYFLCNIRCVTAAFMIFLLFAVAAFAETVLTEADCGKTVRLKPLEEAIVSLPSNPTTGYSWEMVAQGVDTAVVVVSKEFRTTAGASGSIGAGGLEHFRLRLLKAGRFTVTFVYQRPWKKDQEPERIFRVTLEEQ